MCLICQCDHRTFSQGASQRFWENNPGLQRIEWLHKIALSLRRETVVEDFTYTQAWLTAQTRGEDYNDTALLDEHQTTSSRGKETVVWVVMSQGAVFFFSPLGLHFPWFSLEVAQAHTVLFGYALYPEAHSGIKRSGSAW